MWNRMRGLAVALFAFALAAPDDSEAQIQRMRPSDEPTVAVQLSKAFIGESGLSWYTSTLRGRVLAPTGESTAFMADWGLSFAGTDFGSDWTMANPEVGLVFLDDEGGSTGYLSVIVPLAREFGDDDVSVFTASFTDFTWFERFSEDLWSVNAGYTPSALLGDSETARLNMELTGSAVVPRSDGGDTEFFARYAFGVSQDTETLRLRADLEGLAVISEDELSFAERTIHQIVVAVDGLEGGPGFFIRIPVDDALDQVDAVVGASFTF